MTDKEWLDRLDDRLAGGGYVGPSVAERLIRLARKGLAAEKLAKETRILCQAERGSEGYVIDQSLEYTEKALAEYNAQGDA